MIRFEGVTMEDAPFILKIVDFIEAHIPAEVHAVIECEDGSKELLVSTDAVAREDDGVYVVFRDYDRIPATAKGARDWLGY